MFSFNGQQPLTNDIDRNLKAQIDYFSGLGQDSTASYFRDIQNEKDSLFGGIKTGLLDQYDAFQQSLNPSFNEFLSQNNRIANEILPDIQRQSDLVRQKFGPDGELTGQANNYFNKLIGAVNNSINGNIASANNQAGRTGASQSAINAAIAQARQEGLGQLSAVEGEKLNQQQGLLSNFLALQDGLRQQRFDAQNELIRNPLLALNNQVNQLGSGLLSGLQQIDIAELQKLLSGGVGAATGVDPNPQVDMNALLTALVKEAAGNGNISRVENPNEIRNSLANPRLPGTS